MSDCGPAALAMSLAAYGKWVPLREVREVVGNGRDGATAEALVSAARHFGLRARGVQAEVDELGLLPTGSILFWELNHFVVLGRCGAAGWTWWTRPWGGSASVGPGSAAGIPG